MKKIYQVFHHTSAIAYVEASSEDEACEIALETEGIYWDVVVGDVEAHTAPDEERAKARQNWNE